MFFNGHKEHSTPFISRLRAQLMNVFYFSLIRKSTSAALSHADQRLLQKIISRWPGEALDKTDRPIVA